jgi:hypothetical protein
VPCPRCEASFAYRPITGDDSVRLRALRVSEDGCQCFACGAFWPPDKFEWLARLIGLSKHVAVGAYSARMTDIVTSQRLPLILTR